MHHPSVEITVLDGLDENITREVLTVPIMLRSAIDLSQFKDEKGQFKQWLHIFHRSHVRAFRNTHLKTLAVIPWCSDQKTVDIEFHRAVAALDGYVKYPLSWRSFSWRIDPNPLSPAYGIFCPNASWGALRQVLMDKTEIDPARMYGKTEIEFWECMKPFVLVPRADGTLIPFISTTGNGDINANSGLGEAGARALRER